MSDKMDQMSAELSKNYVPLNDYNAHIAANSEKFDELSKKLEELSKKCKMLENMIVDVSAKGGTIVLPPKPSIVQPTVAAAPSTAAFVESPARPAAAPVAKPANTGIKLKDLIMNNDAGFFKWYKEHINPDYIIKELTSMEKLTVFAAVEKQLAKPANKILWNYFVAQREN